jgi:hypothetical protein
MSRAKLLSWILLFCSTLIFDSIDGNESGNGAALVMYGDLPTMETRHKS